jgi:hypothetical protein
MSQRDKALLKRAGLTARDAAALFQMSRQGLALAMAKTEDYLSAEHIALLLAHVLRTNPDIYENLIEFIDVNYASIRHLVLPNYVGAQQVLNTISPTDRIIASCAHSLDHLIIPAAFGIVLDRLLLAHNSATTLVVPENWMLSFIQEKFGRPLPEKSLLICSTCRSSSLKILHLTVVLFSDGGR